MYRINVFSKAGCVQCNGTYRTINSLIASGKINAEDVQIILIDGSDPDRKKTGVIAVATSAEVAPDRAYSFVTEDLGCQQAPVVTVTNGPDPLDLEAVVDSWTGFRPDKLSAVFQPA